MKQTTPLTHNPLIHDTFPIHFNKLVMEFGRANVFSFKNRLTECTSQSAGLVIDMVLYKALRHSSQFTQWLSKHWEYGRESDESSQPSRTSGQ
jgi:hypothetical protein